MSGPAVTSGSGSKQDYGTPWPFITGPIKKRFGEVKFDLAAHAGNAKADNYFTVESFVDQGSMKELAESLKMLPGTADLDSHKIVSLGRSNKKGEELFQRTIHNNDKKAIAVNALKQDWAAVTKKYGFSFLNCEYADIEPWASKCREEGERGADVGLLVPVSISNWWRDHVAGHADTYFMNGRLSFDGKNPYPKDLMFCHFGPRAKGRVFLWRHPSDEVLNAWVPA